jgi:hypothetical protein
MPKKRVIKKPPISTSAVAPVIVTSTNVITPPLSVNPHRKAIVSLLARCRNVITKIKKSKTVLAPALALRLTQDRTLTSVRKVKCRSLLTDNITRWNSTLAMIRSIIPQINELNDVLVADSDSRFCFSAENERTLIELVEVLKPVEIVTKQLEAGKTVTISLCYGLIYWLIKIFQGQDKSVADMTRLRCPHVINVKESILAQLTNRFTSLASGPAKSNVYAMATMLDPRTKSCTSLPAAISQSFLRTLTAQYNIAKQKNAPTPSRLSAPAAPSYCQNAFGNVATSTSSTRNTDELSQYLVEPLILLGDCPLKWWASHESKYPTLRELARKYLSIPASSASSERMWSISGLLVTKHRNRMKSDNICHLMFLKHNLKVMRELGLTYNSEKVMQNVPIDDII